MAVALAFLPALAAAGASDGDEGGRPRNRRVELVKLN